MKRLAVLAAICLISGPTAAQTASCGWELGRWVCRDQSNPYGIGNYQRSFQAGQDLVNQAAQAQRAREAAQAAQDAAQAGAMKEREAIYLRQEVGKMIAAGDCEGAKNMALRYGDIDLAERIVGLCAR